MELDLNMAKEILKKYNQEHLLICYDDLSDEKKNLLLEQISKIDFDLMNTLYENAKNPVASENAEISPIPYVDKSKLSPSDLENYKQIGIQAIKSSKLAVITMAGGQGTRLGHNGPKGTFDLGLESHKSIFEILCDTLLLAKSQYDVTIPWYLMTSDENNNPTIDFFESHNYFGYPKDAVKFFKQGELPMLSTDGKILLNEEGTIKLASDGHGGIFDAIFKNNILEDMKSKGIEWIFIGGVDNVLVKMVDPVLMGMCIKNNTLAGGKSVVKSCPEEKVGVFCLKNSRPSVVEYIEISKEMANMRDENGELLYGESHIICNLFNINAIEEISKNNLPYHTAQKKAKYIDENKNLIVPENPNAYKFESFIFDAFSKLDKMTILRVKREEEFAPVKNATGVDSPETARELYLNYHK